jgi:hypothetical protein
MCGRPWLFGEESWKNSGLSPFLGGVQSSYQPRPGSAKRFRSSDGQATSTGFSSKGELLELLNCRNADRLIGWLAEPSQKMAA